MFQLSPKVAYLFATEKYVCDTFTLFVTVQTFRYILLRNLFVASIIFKILY